MDGQTDRQAGRSEALAHSMRVAEPACAMALICPPALCSRAGFPSVNAERLPFHCSFPPCFQIFSRSHALLQLHLGGNQAKRGDVFASENENPEDCSWKKKKKIRPFVLRYERGREVMAAIGLASIQS